VRTDRRRFLSRSAKLIIAAAAASYRGDGALGRAQSGQTAWGWPQPYDQVSSASLDWLKSRNWLPLSVGYFADLPGYAGAYAVIQAHGLLEKRGLPAKFISFLSGPPILEAFVGGQTQATGYGDLPFWTTFARGNAAIAYGMTAVNYEAAMLVRPDSPLRSIQDLRNGPGPVVIGTLLGSFLEFYISAAASVHGLRLNQDYRLAGMTLREAQFLPKGVDAVVSYDPFVSVMVSRGVGRVIDDAFPYYFNKGYDFVRAEIHENAPDVVQALADAMLEATLIYRLDPDAAARIYHADQRVSSAYPFDVFRDQIRKYMLLYKPTFRHIHADFWAKQDVVLAQSQFEKRRFPRSLTQAEMQAALVTTYMANSLAKVGFKVPTSPVFLPEGWVGTPGKPPYQPYLNIATMTAPQPFPGPGDLSKTWIFDGQRHDPA
jgi:ABC-type nitrate/sulfonate/bicarbonate transport system substrate-binding protein